MASDRQGICLITAPAASPFPDSWQPLVFLFQLPQISQFRHAQTGKCLLPVVVAGFRNSGLTAHILDGTSDFDGLQNGDDLVFSESGFMHGDVLWGHNQYVGTSLKVNGPFFRDAYTSDVLCFTISGRIFRSVLISCISVVFTETKWIPGRNTASQIANASLQQNDVVAVEKSLPLYGDCQFVPRGKDELAKMYRYKV